MIINFSLIKLSRETACRCKSKHKFTDDKNSASKDTGLAINHRCMIYNCVWGCSVVQMLVHTAQTVLSIPYAVKHSTSSFNIYAICLMTRLAC